jgi:hypothetical protein
MMLEMARESREDAGEVSCQGSSIGVHVVRSRTIGTASWDEVLYTVVWLQLLLRTTL